MKCDILVNAIGCIDSAFIDEAENYKPKRKMPVWIWAAASVACLCCVVFFAARFTARPQSVCVEVITVIAGEAVNGYVDYREFAETGEVLITDELKYEIARSKSKDYKDYESINFYVRIIDANGADNHAIAAALWLDETFIRDGTVVLSEDEINAIKGIPGMALIITTEYIKVNDKFLNTVGCDTLDAEVIIKLDYDWLRKHYKGGLATEYWEWRDNYVSGLVNEYAEDYGINYDREIWAGFCAELDTELISRLLQDERTSVVLIPSF